LTTTINASPSNGLVQTADGSGILKVQSNGVTTNAIAWVNFNGTGTVAIRSSYNVSSITDNGTGEYTVNFATALSDSNYSAVASTKQADSSGANGNGSIVMPYNYSTSSVKFSASNALGVSTDMVFVNVAIFGN